MTAALRLILIAPPVADAEIVGVHPIKNILPAVRRLPGETILCMIERARYQARGAGVHRLVLQLRSEGGAP